MDAPVDTSPDAEASTEAERLPEPSLAVAMLEGLPLPLCLRDRQSRYVWTNPAFRSAFGRAAAELLGKTDFDLLPAEQALLEQTRDERVFQDGQDLFFEDRAGVPSTVVGVSGWHIPVKGSDESVQYVLRQWGAPSHAIAEVRSTPDAEESVRMLKEQQSELLKKERLIVLGHLAGSLAHQIRNPLGAISNAVAVLRRELGRPSSADVELALDIAEEEVWVANRIIRDLITYSRIRPPSQRTVGLPELVETVLARELMPDGVMIDQRVGNQRVFVDPGQVCDAIANVIRNACEAMNGQGTLTIASRPDGDSVELSIADTGVGISQEEIALLFEPLITNKPLGIGLGLTTARALVANQAGTLECEGEPGKGARFKLRFPAAVEETTDPL